MQWTQNLQPLEITVEYGYLMWGIKVIVLHKFSEVGNSIFTVLRADIPIFLSKVQ